MPREGKHGLEHLVQHLEGLSSKTLDGKSWSCPVVQ